MKEQGPIISARQLSFTGEGWRPEFGVGKAFRTESKPIKLNSRKTQGQPVLVEVSETGKLRFIGIPGRQ